MSRVRYENTVDPETGTIQITRFEHGDHLDEFMTVITIAAGHDDMANEITAMLNALQVRKDFDANRISSMASVHANDLVGLTGDEHGAVLPVLQRLAREVGNAVLGWAAYADRIWALLTPPEALCVPPVAGVRGGWRSNLSQSSPSSWDSVPQGAEMLLDDELRPLRILYGQAMANVRAYETFLEEVQKRIDQEFGHLPRPSEEGPARLGHKQDRNLYIHWNGGEIGGEFVGVAFNPQRALLVKTALNEYFANHPEEIDQ